MKVLLIRPHEKAPNERGIYQKYIFSFPPLGIAYIGAILKKHGFNVELLDSLALNLTVKQIKEAIKKSKADIVGITAMTQTLPGVYYVGKIVKEILPNSLLIIGGPHMMTYPRETMTHEFFDVGVIGEGEHTMLEIVKKYSQNEDILDILGTVIRTGKNIKINAPRPFIQDLDQIPFPARELLPYKVYKSVDGLHPLTTMMTSRGCPYKCAMCHKGIWGNKLRFRSAENVVEEILLCVEKFKIKEIYMYDDTFTINKKRTLEICRQAREEKIDIRWDIVTRVNTVDRDIIEALHEAGCRKIRFGVESGEQRILDRMKKGITLEQARKAFKICHEIGMETHAYFMIGYPGETKSTVEKTINFAIELDPKWVSFNITVAYPGTELFKEATQYKSMNIDYWKRYTLGQFPGKYPYFLTDELTESVLKNYIKKANRRFYLRPRAILRRILDIRSIPEIKRQYRLLMEEIRKCSF